MKEGPTGIELTNKSSGKIGLLDAKFNHPISSAVNCKLGVGTDLLAASCAAILFLFWLHNVFGENAYPWQSNPTNIVK
jgi:hypothetical protein